MIEECGSKFNRVSFIDFYVLTDTLCSFKEMLMNNVLFLPSTSVNVSFFSTIYS